MSIQDKAMFAIVGAMLALLTVTIVMAAETKLQISATVVQCGKADQLEYECVTGDARCCDLIGVAAGIEEMFPVTNATTTYEVLITKDGIPVTIATTNPN